MSNFYCRYYVGSRGTYGHEFLEYELRPEGRLRYANNSHYKNEDIIRREANVTKIVRKEVLRIVQESGILDADCEKWPKGDEKGNQELDIRIDGTSYKFSCAKIGSLVELKASEDPEGLSVFYYLVQDLKYLFSSVISAHFKVRPT
jgi:protein mago nashi